MSLRKRFLFAILFTIVALAADGKVNGHRAGFDAPKLDAWLQSPVLAAAALPWHDGQRGSGPGSWPEGFRPGSDLPPELSLPIQLKDPKDLGVGKLLVASRGLGDPHFAKTVVLLVHYDDKGVIGLVLNRRTDVPISRVLDLKGADGLSDPVFLGGPVDPTTVFGVYQSSAKMEKAESIFSGVYLISDKTLFEQTLSSRPASSVFHVYVGYAGWTQDQLRAEVQVGAWFVFPADAAQVFKSDPDSLWMQMIQQTELNMAKAEPFAKTSQPVAWFR